MSHPLPLIHYTGLPLRRCADEARDPEWLAARLADPNARCLLLHDNRNLLTCDDENADMLLLAREEADALIQKSAAHPILLGLDLQTSTEVPVLALDVSALDAKTIETDTGGCFIDLRRVGAHIAPVTGSLLGFARGLVYWHASNPFCSCCGSPTRLNRGGMSRRCVDPACEREHFPRNDPAVIMLVEHRPQDGPARCLLGRNHRFKNGMLSTLAGFVDSGESLEEAVRREVFEEAGIETFDERYVASQPWPFPGSLMLGFRAKARTTAITIQANEIAEAGWFTADEIRGFLEYYDEGDGRRLPRRDSIARYLIDLWLAENDY